MSSLALAAVVGAEGVADDRAVGGHLLELLLLEVLDGRLLKGVVRAPSASSYFNPAGRRSGPQLLGDLERGRRSGLPLLVERGTRRSRRSWPAPRD